MNICIEFILYIVFVNIHIQEGIDFEKNIIVLLSIFSVLFLTGCNSNKSMLKK